jgi:hypothetical protein
LLFRAAAIGCVAVCGSPHPTSNPGAERRKKKRGHCPAAREEGSPPRRRFAVAERKLQRAAQALAAEIEAGAALQLMRFP